MKIEQAAGECRITVYTDGHPLFPQIEIGGQARYRGSVSDLHDLRYCIDRVLAQLQKDQPA